MVPSMYHLLQHELPTSAQPWHGRNPTTAFRTQDVSKRALKSDVAQLIDTSVHAAITLQGQVMAHDAEATYERTHDSLSELRGEVVCVRRSLEAVRRHVNELPTVTDVRQALQSKAEQVEIDSALAAMVCTAIFGPVFSLSPSGRLGPANRGSTDSCALLLRVAPRCPAIP
jgi:hypothetical protein